LFVFVGKGTTIFFVVTDAVAALEKSPKSAVVDFSSARGSKSSDTSTPGDGGPGFDLNELEL
jgi:hypothetical protein